MIENAVIVHYNFSLSYCHFSLIFLEGEVTSLLSGPSLNPADFCTTNAKKQWILIGNSPQYQLSTIINLRAEAHGLIMGIWVDTSGF